MDRKQTVVSLSSLIGFVITILLIQFGFIKTILVVFITGIFGLLGLLFDNNRIQLRKLLQDIFNK
ncbi:hypothetical protein FO433_11880 [Weissella cibaria]|jgi:uncharacterized membrane protein|uniref:DUF2273 domain-containing protein n=1 Tax=Weissella cibaria TaxID=137591 RepID=A0A9Q8JJK5_9LACO|nr:MULTISPECIES: hypothetical protein [Weissella]MDQ2126447.1 hypothetical protein [Weissella cibaria]MDQ2159119.1 hypothetical protein [Weissella cibaria]QDG81960.1 hypothetical protein Wei3612_11340 [Weissella cibaria]QMU89581.1 hypothetical protein H3N00_11455 [Weissella cibaria]TVV23887.1 hypothetical protein FO433_11880 [Weissella cibaria]